MKVLALNCGSSTLKFKIYDMSSSISPGSEKRIAYGIVENIGGLGTIKFTAENGEGIQETERMADHAEAARRLIRWLRSRGFMERDGLRAIGHRIVHGGSRFTEAVLVDDEVIHGIEALRYLAPLHNEPALQAIRATGEMLGRGVPMVAVFDTVFHHAMPKRASCYAIPGDVADKHDIRRYGFHGIAHRYMTERYASITVTSLEQARLVTLQLGNGCSAAAVKNGLSIDTSMGLTPLEGLMMGTRSGDVDPHLPGFLAGREGSSIEEVEAMLNTRSGLLGVSGLSRDMRELLEAVQRQDANAVLAVEMFCYRVKKQIGAYLAALGGADAVIFSGGIGENSPEVRSRICSNMDWCGLSIDERRNMTLKGSEGRISMDNAGIHVYVIPVNEELIIARDAARCITGQGSDVSSGTAAAIRR